MIGVKPFFRKLHRWLGLLMALQIIAWMASGLYFSIFPIEVIRGEHLTLAPSAPDPEALPEGVTPAQAWAVVTSGLEGPFEFRQVSLVQRYGSTWYQLTGSARGVGFSRLVDGASGMIAPRLDESGVRDLAQSILIEPAEILSAELVHSVPADSEIRGRQLPVWRVSFEKPESLSLYFDPWTGELLARRTARWRVFDFLWMLHIMDFEERDDFNTPLLQWAAALGLLVALSGIIFWAMTSRLFRRRQVNQR